MTHIYFAPKLPDNLESLNDIERLALLDHLELELARPVPEYVWPHSRKRS